MKSNLLKTRRVISRGRPVERLETRAFLSVAGQVDMVASLVPDSQGSEPAGALIQDRHGNLFGTTSLGGTYGDGTVFELKPGSHAIDLLGTFDGTNGATPLSALTLDSQGDLFGTAEGGGPNGRGTVFEVVRGSHAITTICAFDSGTGSMPYGRLAIDSNGDLFGTTIGGGANNAGTVFEIASGSRAITTLDTRKLFRH